METLTELKTEHKRRHRELHNSLDELFADYIANHPDQTEFLTMPFGEFLQWSSEQVSNPSKPK